MKDKLKGALIAATVIAALAVGGATIAGAASGDDDGSEKPITGSALSKASAAALDRTGGGKVTETEAGDEEGAYEVEVTKNGKEFDVHLDKQFNVLGGVAAEDGSKEDGSGDD